MLLYFLKPPVCSWLLLTCCSQQPIPCPTVTCFPLQLAHLAPTHLAPGRNGLSRTVYGLEGFDRESCKIYMEGCRIRADLAPLKPALQPAPHAIVVNSAFEQCQVSGEVDRGWQGAATMLARRCMLACTAA
jgi:hypothetical protein